MSSAISVQKNYDSFLNILYTLELLFIISVQSVASQKITDILINVASNAFVS